MDEDVDGVGDQGSGDTTMVNIETILMAFLWTEIFSSTAEGSGFAEYQLMNERNSTVYTTL
jgi:hypothetical protein